MQRFLPALAPLLLLAQPAAASAGWSASADGAALSFGQDGANQSVRMACQAGQLSLVTWVGRLPRGVTEGEFGTRLRVFQGRTEVDLGGTGRVQPSGGARVEAAVADAGPFLAAQARQPRLVLVHYAGRTTAPNPTADQLTALAGNCARR